MHRFISGLSAPHPAVIKASQDVRDAIPPHLDASEAEWQLWTSHHMDLLVCVSYGLFPSFANKNSPFLYRKRILYSLEKNLSPSTFRPLSTTGSLCYATRCAQTGLIGSKSTAQNNDVISVNPPDNHPINAILHLPHKSLPCHLHQQRLPCRVLHSLYHLRRHPHHKPVAQARPLSHRVLRPIRPSPPYHRRRLTTAMKMMVPLPFWIPCPQN